jgi:hypothetical protein
MAFSPSGKHLTTAEANSTHGVICHWDPRAGKRQREFPQGRGWLAALSYSAAGDTLAGVHVSQRMALIRWDPATGKERARLTEVLGPERARFPEFHGSDRYHGFRNPRLSHDGRVLAGWTAKNTPALWDTNTGNSIPSFGKPFLGGRELLALSPDGRTIAAPAGQAVDGGSRIQPDVALWEAATGMQRLHIPMSEGEVRLVAFSPDGRLLAAAGGTETIRLWDTWTGKQAGRFTGHRGAMRSLAFAPDGKALASGGGDGTVLIWDVSGLVAAAKKPVGKLGRAELAKCWDDLGGADAARAYQAMAQLARHPGQAEGLLKAKLAAHPGMDPRRLARLIADLDANSFKVREKASKELAALGRLAEGALTRALDGNPSAELRRRLQDLLQKLEGKAEDPKPPQLVRAIEVLERLGTREARWVLVKLWKEATAAQVVREAKASLDRLGRGGRGSR